MVRAQGFSWSKMDEDIHDYIQQCNVCQKMRLRRKDFITKVKTVEVTEPFQCIAIDWFGPLPEDEFGMKYILGTVDKFDRFVTLGAAATNSAFDTFVLFVKDIGHFGTPQMYFSTKVLHLWLSYLSIRSNSFLPNMGQVWCIALNRIQWRGGDKKDFVD